MGADDHRGILLVNLGSPDSPSVSDVRRYLHQFLMDPCVIDVPYLLRKFIVCASILPTRPRHTAAAYQSIWWDEGSPLVVISQRVRDALQSQVKMPIELGMRYGNPSVASALHRLLERGGEPLREVLVIPLYPHYAQSTVRTAVDEVEKAHRRANRSVRITVLPPFYDDPLYISALAASMQEPMRWEHDHLLFSYHGIPEKHLRKEDPTGKHCLASSDCCDRDSPALEHCYRAHCMRATRAVAARLELASERYSVTFQSRLGRDPWLQPFTDHEIVRLAGAGTRRLLIVCPSFVSDCLETLEEIGIRAREDFIAAGGEDLRLIPCVNEHPSWIAALKSWCETGGGDAD
ncbi:MAG: ferrochelatase [Verrucomicrobia bacterium]|nr:ferrochelatase [Verrucomicrobiota bacterium]